METRFDTEFEQLENRLLDLKMAAWEELDLMEKILSKPKDSYRERIFQICSQSEQICLEGQSECRKITLLMHPVARDMRKITAAENAFFDLQRITFMVKEGASQIFGLHQEEFMSILKPHLHTAREMLQLAFVHFCREKVSPQACIEMDDQADEGYEKVMETCIHQIEQQPQSARELIQVLMAAKYLERICDHCTSAAKWSIFGC